MDTSSNTDSKWLNITTPYATHRRLLLKALKAATGPVIELGIGPESTPYLRDFCFAHNRYLVSCESNAEWFAKFKDLHCPAHQVLLVKPDYSDAPIETLFWGVAFVDSAPCAQRHVDAIRLAERAQIVVIHDTELDHTDYQLELVWPHYRYRLNDNNGGPTPWTSAVSNYLDLTKL